MYLDKIENFQNNGKFTVLYIYNNNEGGFCDFLKFCMHAIYLCKTYNLKIKIKCNTYLTNFIDISEEYIYDDTIPSQDILKYDLQNYNRTKISFDKIVEIHKLEYLIIRPPYFYRLKNIDFQLQVHLNFKDYTTNESFKKYNNIFDFIKIKKNIQEKCLDVLKTNSLEKNNYICFHLRCGDRYLENKPSSGHCLSDNRLSYKPGELQNVIKNIIRKNNLNENECIFICDSTVVKNIIKSNLNDIIVLNTKILHVGHKYNLSEIDIYDGFVDTMIDFLILYYSRETYALSYSGFSILPSLLSNKNVVCCY